MGSAYHGTQRAKAVKTSKKPPAPAKLATCWMIAKPDGELNTYYSGTTKSGVIYTFQYGPPGPQGWDKWPTLYLQGYRCIRVAITPVSGKTKEQK